VGKPLVELWEQLKPNFSFWTASLYLFWLIRNLPLNERDLKLLETEFLFAKRQFISPLREITMAFTRVFEKSERSEASFVITDEVEAVVLSDLGILTRALETADS